MTTRQSMSSPSDPIESEPEDSSATFRSLISLYQNFNLGGSVWLLWKDDVGYKGKVALYICKTIINYLESALGLLFLYLIYFRPYAVRPQISGTLAAFDLDLDLAPGLDTNTLRYDLATNITFWSDHRIWAIRYNHFTAQLYFNGTEISPPDDTFPKFKGRTRRHRTLYPLLCGQATNISDAMAEEFSKQQAQRWFALEVRLRATLTYVIWPTWYHYYYEYECWLHFPTSAAATPAVSDRVKCSKGKRFGLSFFY